MRISFFLNDFGHGGAERVVSLLANRFAAQGHAVSIYTVYQRGQDAYELDSRIQRFGLIKPLKGLKKLFLKRIVIRLLAEKLKVMTPDVLVAFGVRPGFMAIKAAGRLKIPVAVSERNDPRRPNEPFWVTWTKRSLFRKADKLVLQSSYAQDYYLKLSFTNTAVIPNPHIPFLNVTKQKGTKVVLAVGRLEPQKGFEDLLDAFGLAVRKLRDEDWKLVIVGEGKLRGVLESKVGALGLKERVELPGKTNDVASYYGRAEIFVMSSLYEGFPNVLLEAQSVGLPSVVFDCPGGVRELIRHDQTGFLIAKRDPALFAEFLVKLMENPELREKLGAAAALSLEKYALSAIEEQWLRVLSPGAVP